MWKHESKLKLWLFLTIFFRFLAFHFVCFSGPPVFHGAVFKVMLMPFIVYACVHSFNTVS